MTYPELMRCVVVAATLGAGCVLAQTNPPAPAQPAPAVLSDVGPRPAEDRSSTGAIVLENSLVRAQRESAFQRSSAQTGVTTVGRGVVRDVMKAKAQAELAQVRESEAVNLHTRGAGSLTGR
jgi:hypothetical protein